MEKEELDALKEMIPLKELEKTLGRKVYKTEYANILELYPYLKDFVRDEQIFMEMFKYENRKDLQYTLINAFDYMEREFQRRGSILRICFSILKKVTGDSKIDVLIYDTYWNRGLEDTVTNLIVKASRNNNN